jgi:DNA-binding CsgD family transcriptional regulator/PAS domain-containing protein
LAVEKTNQQLLAVIGEVYDCAIDASRWEKILVEINHLMNAAYCVIHVARPGHLEPKLLATSPWDIAQLNRAAMEYGESGIPGLEKMGDFDVDSAQSTLSRISEVDFEKTAFFQNFAQPQNLRDGCMVNFVKTPQKMGVFSMITSANRDPISSSELEFLSLLSPHLRRAAMIGDLFDYQRLQIESMRRVIDHLQTAVIFVSADSKIRFCNQAAESMLSAATPIHSQNGILQCKNQAMVESLADAIARTAGSSLDLGRRGIGIPISAMGQPAAVAFVLPITTSNLLPSIEFAIAAVFISTQTSNLPLQQDVLSTLFDLTPAEARTMISIGSGSSVLQTAQEHQVSENTVKTHLNRIFGKVGVNRQGDLMKVLASITPPVSKLSISN